MCNRRWLMAGPFACDDGMLKFCCCQVEAEAEAEAEAAQYYEKAGA